MGSVERLKHSFRCYNGGNASRAEKKANIGNNE
jgi:hypothetical protein